MTSGRGFQPKRSGPATKSACRLWADVFVRDRGGLRHPGHGLPVKRGPSSRRPATGRPDCPPVRLPWVGGGQMDFDPRPELPDPRSDLQDLEPDRIKLGPGPDRPLKMTAAQGVQQPLGQGMEEEPELVGFETMTGGPIGAQMSLVLLNQELHPASVSASGPGQTSGSRSRKTPGPRARCNANRPAAGSPPRARPSGFSGPPAAGSRRSPGRTAVSPAATPSSPASRWPPRRDGSADNTIRRRRR